LINCFGINLFFYFCSLKIKMTAWLIDDSEGNNGTDATLPTGLIAVALVIGIGFFLANKS